MAAICDLPPFLIHLQERQRVAKFLFDQLLIRNASLRCLFSKLTDDLLVKPERLYTGAPFRASFRRFFDLWSMDSGLLLRIHGGLISHHRPQEKGRINLRR